MPTLTRQAPATHTFNKPDSHDYPYRMPARATTTSRCTICGKPTYAKGWCRSHYLRARDNNGDPLATTGPTGRVTAIARGTLKCDICGDTPVVARGYCGRHYKTWAKHGDARYVAPTPTPPRDCWLTLPQTAALLDIPTADVIAWTLARRVPQHLTGTDTSPDRSRHHRYRLTDIEAVARARGRRPAHPLHPDQVTVGTVQAADYLGISTSTLKGWARRGHITPHDRTGHQRQAVYLLADLIDHTAVRSTP